jgi:hypothetical protein
MISYIKCGMTLRDEYAEQILSDIIDTISVANEREFKIPKSQVYSLILTLLHHDSKYAEQAETLYKSVKYKSD